MLFCPPFKDMFKVFSFFFKCGKRILGEKRQFPTFITFSKTFQIRLPAMEEKMIFFFFSVIIYFSHVSILIAVTLTFK